MNTALVIAPGPGLITSRSTTDNGSASRRSFFQRIDLAGGRGTRALETKCACMNGAPPANLDVLDLTHDAICVRSMSGVIEHWNRAAEKLYGWSAREAIGRVSHVLFRTVFPVPLDRIEAELLHTGAWEGELVHAVKDGTRVTVASRWSLLRDEASAPIAILEAYTDITERKRAQAECAKLEERLRQAEKLETIGRFACGVAHDFNNVLGAILPNADMLAREAPADTSLKRRAQNVLAAAERGRHLAHQILSYCSNQSAERMPTDVCRSVADTLELVRSSLPHGIALHSTIPCQPLVVMGDDTQLHQIVMNLCTNAIHAMKAGGALRVAVTALEMDADCALSHGSLRAGRHVRVSIEDCGCGMDEATLTRIFEPFFTTRGRGYGTGLGLALVQAIVTDFGGAIDVKSAPGEGSSFSIYLPITDERTP